MTTVIFHANCVDGFTSAWACWRKFGDSARYIPAQYGDVPPPGCPGDDVVIVDFSYPRSMLEQMARMAKSLLVLDHHRSAEAALAGLPSCKFDMSRSGAGLAWDELHGGKRPRLVDYVEDRDLWRWALPQSKKASAYISTIRRTFAEWDLLARDFDHDLSFESCLYAGGAVLRSIDAYVDLLADETRLVTIGGHAVPCLNTTHATSELVGAIAERNPDAPFAAGWFQKKDGQFVYSLRSRGGFDVSEVARLYGGGGHRAAAGFTVGALL